MLVQLSEFWLDEHHSDVLLVIVVGCADVTASSSLQQHAFSGCARCELDCAGTSPGCCNCAPAVFDRSKHHVLARIPCHRVLLSAASSYFSALLSPTWTEGTVTTGIRQVPVVLSDPDDVPAMIALLKCIYCGDVSVLAADLIKVLGPQQILTAAASNISAAPFGECAAVKPVPGCSCTQALYSLTDQANLNKLCWQELSIRVVRLADQLSVPGVMQAAAGKLSCLFSYQLSWPAVLAVLWLPPELAQQPSLKDLRQMAVNRVTQDLKHLDPCLSSSFGRSVLQHLPPDALATLLSSDQLALVSENSTLVAIDVWLAGPVAAALNATSGSAAANQPVKGSSNSEDQKHACGHEVLNRVTARSKDAMEVPGSSTVAAGQPVVGERLAEALQLLLRQVRLPLCSGAFLAAAVCQRPWLCVGLKDSPELQLMQQYYSCDSQSRYALAMKLIRTGQSCPWSVDLRRGLPSAFNPNSSSIHSSSSTGNSCSGGSMASAYTGLSQIRAILLSGQQNGVTAARMLSSGSSSSSSMALDGCQLNAGSRSSSSGVYPMGGLKLQQQPGRCQLQAVQIPGGSTALGVILDTKVLGGYNWEVALVAVPIPDNCSRRSSTSNSDSDDTVEDWCGDLAACACSIISGGSTAVKKVKQQLCLSICCKPAWADVLCPDDSHQHAAAGDDRLPLAEAAAAAAAEATHTAPCGAPLHPTPATAAALYEPSSPAAAGRCVTCGALWATAGAKAAEAIARHAPLASLHITAAASEDTIDDDACMMRAADDDTAAAAAAAATGAKATDMMQLCGTLKDTQAADTRNMTSCIAFQDAAAAPGPSAKLAHLDVVVGVQLLACSSKEQLQQLAGSGPGSISRSKQGSPAETHVACLLEWDAQGGVAQALLPVDIRAINTGTNMLQTRVEGAAAAGSRVLEGWQPELWSMLAPNGALHWHVSIRPLND